MVIVIATIEFTYQSLPENDSVNFDDLETVFENPSIQNFQKLDWNTVHDLDSNVLGNHVALTQYTHAIDYKKYGNAAHGHHLTSLRIYEATAVLVFIAIFLLSQNMFAAFIIALIFGINPTHVEAIAWISARKDQMMGLMVFTTILVYFGYLESLKLQSGWKKVFVVIVFQTTLTISFYLAIKSKGMAVTLPIALMAIDYLKGRSWKQSVSEKLILFAMMLYFGIDAYYAQQESELTNKLNLAPLEHITLGSYGLVVQTFKFFIPYHGRLCAHIDNEYNQSWGMPCAILVAFWIWSLWKFRHVREYVFGTVFYFSFFIIVQYFPVANIIMAERYIHVGSVGLCYFPVRVTIRYLGNKNWWIKGAVGIIFCGYCIFLIANTQKYLPVWKDSWSLWNDVLKKQPRNRGAAFKIAELSIDENQNHLNYRYAIYLSTAVMADGQYQKECLPIRIHAYLQTNNLELARQDCYEYLHYEPKDSLAGIVLTNTANQFTKEGQTDSAIVWYTRLAQFPGNPKKIPLIYRNLAVLYKQQKSFDQALRANSLFLATAVTQKDSLTSDSLKVQILEAKQLTK